MSQNAIGKEPIKPMTGWKTKWGTILLIVGGAVMGAAEIAPDANAALWMNFAAKLVTGIGTGLTAWGLGHKLEKNKPVVIQVPENKPKLDSFDKATITKQT